MMPSIFSFALKWNDRPVSAKLELTQLEQFSSILSFPFAPAAMDPGSPMKCRALCPFCSKRHEDFIFLWWSAQSRLLSVYSWFIWFFETVDFQELIISSRFKVLGCMWDLKMFSPSMRLVLQTLSHFQSVIVLKHSNKKLLRALGKGQS